MQVAEAIPTGPPARWRPLVSAAGFGNVVAPDSLASLFGANLTDRVVPGGQLPLELDGVSVRIAGRSGGLIFVSRSQINFWLPPNTPTGSSAGEVRNTRTGSTATGSIVVSTVARGCFQRSVCGRTSARSST